jgi:hypothetical protein
LVRGASRKWSPPGGTHGGRRRLGARARRRGGHLSSRAQGGEGSFLRAKGTKSWHGPRHGKYGDVWAAAGANLRANGGEAVHRPAIGRATHGTGLLPRPITRILPQCAIHPARTGGRRRASACALRASGRRATTTSHAASRAWRGSARLKFHLALFEPIFLPIF